MSIVIVGDAVPLEYDSDELSLEPTCSLYVLLGGGSSMFLQANCKIQALNNLWLHTA
jgi:hypothetical protein